MSIGYVSCGECSRHVRTEEPKCPFCGGTLTQPLAEKTLPRLARSALFVVALGTAGCGNGGTPGNDAANDAPAASDTQPDAPLAVGAYGAPPPTDAATE